MPKLALLAAALLAATAALAEAPQVPSPALKAVQAPFASLHPSATFRIGATADWVLAAEGAIWVGGTGPDAVHRIDPRTNREVARVELPGEACAGLAAGFGSLWVPLCAKPANTLARVDLRTNRLVAVLPIGPAAAEGGIAAGGDSVWMIVDAKGTLARIDPKTGRVRQRIATPAGSYNPRFDGGVVWVSGHDADVVTAVDAASGKVLGTVATGRGPRFLTAGAGAVWTLDQGDGTVARIDERTRRRTALIEAHLPGHGGDIAYGAGRVWATLSGAPLTAIDARTNHVERQWVGPGGDSLTYAYGAVWLTDYKAGTLARYPVGELTTNTRSSRPPGPTAGRPEDKLQRGPRARRSQD